MPQRRNYRAETSAERIDLAELVRRARRLGLIESTPLYEEWIRNLFPLAA